MSITNTETTSTAVGTVLSLEPVLDDEGNRRKTSQGNHMTRITVEFEDGETEELMAWVAPEVAEVLYPIGETGEVIIEEKVRRARSLQGFVRS